MLRSNGRTTAYALLENGRETPIIVKAVFRKQDRVLMVFTCKGSSYTCEFRQEETICLQGAYWGFESFQEALQLQARNLKEVVLTKI